MRGFLMLALLLGGCADEPPTVRDAAEDWAAVTCERFVRCGWTTDDYDSCVRNAVEHLCRSYDCDHSYNADRLDQCLADYGGTDCAVTRPVCTF